MEHLSNEEILAILDRAQDFEHGATSALSKSYNVANLFFEPSTRTKTSFEMAERKLGCTVIPFDAGFSSALKGETMTTRASVGRAIRNGARVMQNSVTDVSSLLCSIVRTFTLISADVARKNLSFCRKTNKWATPNFKTSNHNAR